MSSGTESIADDSGTCRGVVLSRAATILRSIETQPSTGRFVPQQEQPSGEGGQRQGKALTLSRVPQIQPTNLASKNIGGKVGWLLFATSLISLRDEGHGEAFGMARAVITRGKGEPKAKSLRPR